MQIYRNFDEKISFFHWILHSSYFDAEKKYLEEIKFAEFFVIFLIGQLDFCRYSNVLICLFDAERYFHVGKNSGYTYTQKDNKIWAGVLYVVQNGESFMSLNSFLLVSFLLLFASL